MFIEQNMYTNADLIFQANISSSGYNPEFVLGFEIIRYILRNCCNNPSLVLTQSAFLMLT